MIYLDNAATSWPKPDRVITEVTRCMKEYCANPGRGGHRLSIASGMAVNDARESMAAFFNIKDPMKLCFTRNATEALNLAIYGLIRPGDHVITTCMEHNSVLRPLKTLERDLGTELTILGGDSYGEIDPGDLEKSIKANTRLVISTLSSNVNGITMPVGEIGEICRKHGIPFLLDASQGAGSINIDVEQMKVDLMAFPGHKGLLGPQGTGGLYAGFAEELRPLMQGGTGSNSELVYQPDFLPDKYESGTLNTPGIVGLACGIDFIRTTGIENIKLYRHLLVKRLHEGICGFKGIKLYNRLEMEKNSGIVAFNFEEVDSSEISYMLDKEYDAATRAGLHCAPSAHETLGTLGRGVVRMSVGCFNTIDEIDLIIEALKKYSEKI